MESSWPKRIVVACFIIVLAEIAGLASIALEIVISIPLTEFFNNSADIHLIVVAPIVEESMKASMFILFWRYRESLGVNIGAPELVLACWGIGAGFGFYEWSAHELYEICISSPRIFLIINNLRVLIFRLFLHGGTTGLLGFNYWLCCRLRYCPFLLSMGFIGAICLHSAHNAGYAFIAVLGQFAAIPYLLCSFISAMILIGTIFLKRENTQMIV